MREEKQNRRLGLFYSLEEVLSDDEKQKIREIATEKVPAGASRV